MKHLQKFLRETAAAGSSSAGDVAGVRGALFARPMKREKMKNVKVQRIVFHNDARNLRESFLREILSEYEDGHFKAVDVISKLKAAEKKHEFGKDTVAFGIEDDEGNTVKVYVRANQAEQFEKTLSEILNDDQEETNEIPEVLFNLKDKFDIVHVEWGQVEEDEEELELPPEGEGEISSDELGVEEPTDEEGDLELGDQEMDLEGGESEAESALDKVISMLKADAEARTAEAKAKEAEAKAKEAEYATKAAEVKIRGEEEVLDMEAHFKKQNDEKKEAQKLAKLARYRHEKAAEMGEDNEKPAPEEQSLSREDLE